MVNRNSPSFNWFKLLSIVLFAFIFLFPLTRSPSSRLSALSNLRETKQTYKPPAPAQHIPPYREVIPPTRDSSPIRKSLTCDDPNAFISQKGTPCTNLQKFVTGLELYYVENPKVSYIYCSLPKNGCTYHVALMHWLRGDRHIIPGVNGEVHDVENKKKLFLELQSSEKIAAIFHNPSIPKYMVVRNPLHRTLSAYRNKVEPVLPAHERTVKSFHDWVYSMFDGRRRNDAWSHVNPHWRPQTKLCGFNKRGIGSFFRVFRTEDPHAYVDYLYDIIPHEYLDTGWSKAQNQSLREFVLGPRVRTGNTTALFYKYFNDVHLFDHLAKELAEDIDSFGYREDVQQMRSAVVSNLRR